MDNIKGIWEKIESILFWVLVVLLLIFTLLGFSGIVPFENSIGKWIFYLFVVLMFICAVIRNIKSPKNDFSQRQVLLIENTLCTFIALVILTLFWPNKINQSLFIPVTVSLIFIWGVVKVNQIHRNGSLRYNSKKWVGNLSWTLLLVIIPTALVLMAESPLEDSKLLLLFVVLFAIYLPYKRFRR